MQKNQRTQNYEFDANGNMTSVSVDTVAPIKSFLWDEENRLLAVNNNGSVSCYFYDAAGERSVKISSESEMVHVNGKKVGENGSSCKFTAYVSPYFIVSNGGAYTKHIYAASQRIASKLGNEDGFGADPRRMEMAGGKKISDFQKGNVGERFKALGYEYSAPEKEKVEKDSTMDSESEEKLIFFYHPDHLGSTSYVTDADGNIAQHVEYIPYGEIFVEERNSQFSTNFLFNAKELDNETGLYYYGARYLDPTGAMWLSVDPMWEKYVGASPYNYCHGNPIMMVDPDGREDIVVCGSQYDESSGNKLMFVNEGIRAIREMSKNNPNENRTMLLFKEGYTDNQINEIQNSVNQFGGNLKLIDSASELIDYVNNKNGDRATDKINNMEIYSHGLPGSIEFGYSTYCKNSYALNSDNINDLKRESFKGLASNIRSFACRTALGNESTAFCLSPDVNKSFAQKIATATGANVYAFARRTNYAGHIGSTLDRHTFLSYLMPIGVDPVPIPKIKKVDGAAFAPFGSNRGVVAGDTPVGLSIFPYHLKP